MRKSSIAAVFAITASLASSHQLCANELIVKPHYSSAAFPAINPPGYYTTWYYFGWQYPWYANYNYSYSPYANWQQYGGVAGPAAYAHSSGTSSNPIKTAEATVKVTLPADAKLLFNGTASTSSGSERTFRTPPLIRGREYAYELTSEVVRDGKVSRVTEKVTVRAGAESRVTLANDAVQTASK